MTNKEAATTVSSTKSTAVKSTGRLATSTSANHPKALYKYINNICAMSKRTAQEYYLRLSDFKSFIISGYRIMLDNIITKINYGLAPIFSFQPIISSLIYDKNKEHYNAIVCNLSYDQTKLMI